MTTGFVMTPEAAEAFFELCLIREAVTYKERMEILQELAAAGRAKWFKTDATKEQIVKSLVGNYNVFTIGKKNGNQESR